MQVASDEENVQNHMIIQGEVALQVSRNLYQYFRADSEITTSREDMKMRDGNIITIASGHRLAQSVLPSYPITIFPEEGIRIRTALGEVRSYAFCSGLGLICLRPLPNERLEAVVWGFDESGLRRAARLLPMITVSKTYSALF